MSPANHISKGPMKVERLTGIAQDCVVSAVLFIAFCYCWGVGDGRSFAETIDNVVHLTLWFLPRNLAVGAHWVFSLVAIIGSICLAVSPIPGLGNRKVVKAASFCITLAAAYQFIMRCLTSGPWCIRSVVCVIIPVAMSMYSPRTKAVDGLSQFSAWVVSLRIPPFAALIAPVSISLITMESLGASIISAEKANAAVFALCLLQAAANQINSVADFYNGIDDVQTASDRSLVDGILTPKSMIWSAVCLTSISAVLLLSTLVGLDYSYWAYAVAVWTFEASLAVFYTYGPFPLKYYAMGDLIIFLFFGPGVCAMLALWTADPTVSLSIIPVVFLFVLPSLLVTIGILNANNIRDLDSDTEAGIYTVANLLGHKRSRIYFTVLQLAPHLLSLLIAYFYHCYGILFSLAIMPRSLSTVTHVCLGAQDDPQYKMVVKYASHTTLMYGLITAMGIATAPMGAGLGEVSLGGVFVSSAVCAFLYRVG
ncbi:UbiA prenyltransferase domain-containing protein 1 [Perkinsus chesapeaki]|uniref:UbiA prenyltransferase domain-containing protein 1 n=1 Tax=Perkinsus chesapeaki TaxID=330153 RepID=A0A7J6MMR4_PERCH|nr:UbiA prenyltransferase domain-containing protein 1 [Perkinsus chesapeaki]